MKLRRKLPFYVNFYVNGVGRVCMCLSVIVLIVNVMVYYSFI